jgi:hypothetical protein
MNSKRFLKHFLKTIIWKLHPKIFERVVHYRGQIFSIGVYTGKDTFSLTSANGVRNPVLCAADVTDVPAAFVSDPFVLQAGGTWYMFFEVMNKLTRLGEIGLATSNDGYNWMYEHIVLKEPFHLSYPHVFEWNDDFYIIPDSATHGIRLYKAMRFPCKWQCIGMILNKYGFVDSSIIFFDNKWWLFTAHSPRPSEPKALYLYYADEPIGPWYEHKANPIVESNPFNCRPAGKMLIIKGRLIRFAQEGIPHYGSCVRAFEVLELSTNTYAERDISSQPVLCGGSAPWNEGGMHHIDAHILPSGKWMAYVTGWYLV